MTKISYFDPLNREYPAPMAKTIVRAINSATNPSFNFADDDDLREGVIVGFAIRRAASGRTSPNGRALLNDNMLDSGFLKIKAGGHDDFFQYPLSMLVHDDTVHAPGQYAQVLVRDWNVKESGIQFSDVTGAVITEDFEMVVYYMSNRYCHVPPPA